jgi:hypothetical protein
VTLVLRIGLALLATVELFVGIWNQFWPRTFYDQVPTVNLTPPFAEHYARDFGGASIGLGIVLLAAVIVPRTVLVIPALLGMTAFGLPHFVFHVHHLENASASESAILVATTAFLAFAPPLLIVVAGVRASSLSRRNPPVEDGHRAIPGDG